MTEASDKSKLTESEFLQLQADQAKAQIHQALNDAKAALTGSVDPRELTRKHPWISIVSAAAAGFVAAAVVIPSKQELELRRLERVRRAMNPQPTAPPPAANGVDHSHAEKPSWVAMLFKEIIQIVRPILLAAITANIKSGANQPPADPAAPGTQGPDNPA
jgi:hypothetical protein